MKLSHEAFILASAGSYALFGTSPISMLQVPTDAPCTLQQKTLGTVSSMSVTASQIKLDGSDLETLVQRWREANRATHKVKGVHDYDDGICLDLIDPNSLNISQPLSSHTVMAELEMEPQGQHTPLDIDDVDLMILDI